MFISLYTTRLILNSLGASDFGIFNIVGGAIAMLGFLNASMASATQRFMSYSEGEGNKEKQKSIFNVSFVLHLGISFVVGIALLIAGYFFFNGILNIPENRIFAAKVVYGSLIVSTMFTVMTVPYDAVMNAHENMKYYAIIGVFESILKLLVAIICVYTTYDRLIIYGILMACIPVITLTIMRIYCHKHYNECIISPQRYWDRNLTKNIASFAGWSFVSNATGMIGNYGLGIVLNIFFQTILNAAQGIATQTIGLLSAFTTNMLKAINPIIFRSAGAKTELLSQKIAMTTCKFTFLTTALFALPFMIETPYILKIWLKDVPEYAVIFSRLQIIRTLIEQLTTSLAISVTATGFIKELSISKTIINILPLPLIYISFQLGAPPYMMYLISISIWSVIGGFINLYYAQKICNITRERHIKGVILPCIGMSIIILSLGYIGTLLFQEGFIRLCLSTILSFFFFVVLSYKLCMNREEKQIIINFIKKINLKFRLKNK